MANIGTEQEIITVTPEPLIEPFEIDAPAPAEAPVEAPATVPA